MDQKNEDLFFKGMLLTMVCWGFSWVSNKILASYGPTENVVLFRIVVTFVSLGLILPFIKEKLAYPMRGLGVLLLASLSITLYFFLFIGGLQRGMPGAGGVLVTTLNPIVTFAFSLVLNRIWPTKREAIGLGIGVLAGVFLLQLWKQWDLVLSQGNIYFLSATVVWVILSRFTARAKEYSSSATFSFWMYAISTVFTFFLTDTGETIRMMHQADAVFWLNLFFSATITTSIATTFYFYATARIGVNKASSFLFLVPFSAALGAWLFIGEVPQWHTVVGGLLGIVAVYVLTKK